jgi:hypothetical protein
LIFSIFLFFSQGITKKLSYSNVLNILIFKPDYITI